MSFLSFQDIRHSSRPKAETYLYWTPFLAGLGSVLSDQYAKRWGHGKIICNSYVGTSGFLKLWDLKILFIFPEKGMGSGECQLESSQPSILPPTFGQQPEQSKGCEIRACTH